MKPEFQRYQHAFCAYARNPRENSRPEGVNAKRIGIYADLLRNNIDNTLSSCFPVSRKVLGMRCWNRMVRNFFAQHRCNTPLFRQIPEEFLQWLSAGRHDLPPYLPQLAHYEWVELAVAVSDEVPPIEWDETGDLLVGQPVLNPALMLLSYDWPVQKISPRHKPTQPLSDPVWLLVYRDAADEVRFIELNPVSAQLIQLLQANAYSGHDALVSIAQTLQHPEPEQVLAFGSALLADLREKEVILGVVTCK